MTEEKLFDGKYEKRMYFFVPYSLSGIQKGIQAGHAALRYAHTFKDKEETWDFVQNHETWIVLNGGTTNSVLKNKNFKRTDIDPYFGSLDNIMHSLYVNNIKCAGFTEPDLNDALTAVCFIADERAFNYNKYPDWTPGEPIQTSTLHFIDVNNLKNAEGYTEDEWNTLMTPAVLFLRELIRNKKLA